MDIKSFKASFDKKGLARNNLFKVAFPTFTALPDITAEQLNFMCKNVNLPGRSMSVNERVIGIPKAEKVVNGFLIDDIQMTFMMTNSYEAKRYFDYWTGLTMDFNTYELKYKYGTTPGTGFTSGYTRGVNISQFNQRNQIIYECTLIDAFPTLVNAIDFTNEQGGLTELTVQLSYNNWKGKYFANEEAPV